MSSSNILIGAHVADEDPLTTAEEIGADLVQFFLADPQKWNQPKPRGDEDVLRTSESDRGVKIVIHSPYVLNVATSNNRIRIPSRKLLHAHAKAAAAIDAIGLVVHGGHVSRDDDPQLGYDNWRKLFERAAEDGGFPLPILIENTAGGDFSMARRLESIARLWDAIGEFDPGFCLDTCHAHAGGIELSTAVDKIKAITGRIDLIHCNDSRDEFDSGRDRHTNIGDGHITPSDLVDLVRSAGAPAVCETPSAGHAADIAFLREGISR